MSEGAQEVFPGFVVIKNPLAQASGSPSQERLVYGNSTPVTKSWEVPVVVSMYD